MGSGKTTVGRKLAERLGFEFHDSDDLIEKTSQRTISEIFQRDGETYFRDLETEVLRSLQGSEKQILATGGGVVLRLENVELLKKLGPVILLNASVEAIHQRTKMATHRPLLQVDNPRQEIEKRLADRHSAYTAAADYSIETTHLTPDQVTEAIIKWLKSR